MEAADQGSATRQTPGPQKRAEPGETPLDLTFFLPEMTSGMIVRPQQVMQLAPLQSAEMRSLIKELASSATRGEASVDPTKIQQVAWLINPGPSPDESDLLMIMQTTDKTATEAVIAALRANEFREMVPAQYAGKEYLKTQSDPKMKKWRLPVSAICQFSDTVVVQTPNEPTLKKLLDGVGGKPTALSAKLAAMPPEAEFFAVGEVPETMRPMLEEQAKQAFSRSPLPKFAELAPAVKGGTLQMTLQPAPSMKATLDLMPGASAEEVSQLLKGGLKFGQAILPSALAAMQQQAPPALKSQAQEVANIAQKAVNEITITPKGDTVEITTGEIVTTEQLTALFAGVPAVVKKIREDAQSLVAASNLRQIGLAILNAAANKNGKIPAGFRDADGKELLSWRVEVLPYLDHLQLYDSLDRKAAWDSDANIDSVRTTPLPFQHPTLKVPEGKTVFLCVKGKGLFWDPSRVNSLDSITAADGLSNTVAAVVVKPEKAVPWASPEDYTPDFSDKTFGLHVDEGGNVTLLFGDGSVRRIPFEKLDEKTFRAMLTTDGREPIPVPN